MIRLDPLDRQRIRGAQAQWRWTLALALALAFANPASAQDGGVENLLPETDEASPDPLGTGGTRSLADVPIAASPEETLEPRGPVPPAVDPQVGEILTAAPGVRELEHRVEVLLADGLARVEVRMRFANRGLHAAELRYRLPAPPGATLAGFELCQGERCQPGHLDLHGDPRAYEDGVRSRGSADGTIGWARWLTDERGEAFILRAAPIPARGGLNVTLRYVADAPLRGGVARFVMPARGADVRAAPTTLSAAAPELLGVSVEAGPAGTPATVDAWFDVEVLAQAARARRSPVSVTHFPCGAQTCGRVYEAAGPAQGEARDLIVVIDASPSTEGPARGRIAPAVAALLTAAPPASRVRMLVFAAEARPLVERALEPALVPMASIVEATSAELGSATRFEAAWAVMAPWISRRDRSRRPLVVIVGDGGLTTSDEGAAAFRAARAARVPVSVFNVANRSVTAALGVAARRGGGRVVDAGAAAEEAIRGRGTAPLEERASALLSPRLRRRSRLRGAGGAHLAALHAGEEVRWEGRLEGRRVHVVGRRTRSIAADPLWADALAARALGRSETTGWAHFVGGEEQAEASPYALTCAEDGPERSAWGVSRDDAPIIAATPRSCALPPSPAAATHGRGMPAETVLAMLRQRVMPAARGCFRQDRRGRLDYSTRAELRLRLADQEVVDATVVGTISPRLRSCLAAALDTLDVPRFRGAVLVRYPLRTERVDAPPIIELDAEAAERIDAVLDD